MNYYDEFFEEEMYYTVYEEEEYIEQEELRYDNAQRADDINKELRKYT